LVETPRLERVMTWGREPWWTRTVHLALVVAFGVVAVLAHADPALVATVAVMVCAALAWKGPWPSITIGGRHDPE
jgi:hypothetical protein